VPGYDVRALDDDGRELPRGQIGNIVIKLPLPPGYRVWYGGEYENQNDTFPEMVNALLISSIAIYLILMFQFRSVIDPLVVMAAIPLGLLGASVGASGSTARMPY